jgi:hypothetical protein
MHALFLVELGATAHEFFAVRGSEENGTVDVAEVAFFHMVLLGLWFLHL